MDIYCFVFLVICHKDFMLGEATQSDDKNNDGLPKVENFHDIEAYRIAAGEKYFASVGSNDRDDWVDPYNMFDYNTELTNDLKSVEKIKSAFSEGVEGEKDVLETGNKRFPPATASPKCDFFERSIKCSQNEYVYVTRWIKKFLKRMNYNPDMNLEETQTVQFSVLNREMQEVCKLLDSENVNLQDMEKLFDAITMRFHIFQPETRKYVEDVIHFTKQNYAVIFTLFVCLVSSCYLHLLYSRRHHVTLVVLLVFFTSIIWTWIHMYQKEVAKKQVALHSGYPKECEQNNLSYLNIISLYLQRTFTDVEDRCAKYYEAHIIDPFWSITPLVVVSETLSNFILQPLGSIASHCNMFLKNLFSGMPLALSAPTLFLLFILMLMLFKYRLRLPFFFATLEPAAPARNAERVEFLPFRSAGVHGIANDAPTAIIESSVRTIPQHSSQNFHNICFGESGDHLKIASSDPATCKQIVVHPSEVHELSTEKESNDSILSGVSKSRDCGDVSLNTSISTQAETSFSKSDQSCQTDTV